MGEPQQIDLSEFVGTWVSSERRPRAIAGLSMAARDGELFVRLLGAGARSGVGWGEQRAEALFTDGPASGSGAGCLIDCDLGFARAHLQIQLKLGVAVVGSFLTFGDGAGARRGFVREFLGRLPAGEPSAVATAARPVRQAGPADRAALEAALHPGRGPRMLLGRWLVTAPTATGPAELEIEAGQGDTTRLRLRGPSGEPDGEVAGVPAEAFGCIEEDGVPSCCLLARDDQPAARVELQIRQNKGILAVTRFTAHAGEEDLEDYVTRELFFRASSGQSGGAE